MVEQHYRWDFIGLSTDVKPTPATSEKVVNGSTFYCSDNSKLYVWYKTQWYEKTATGGGGTSYTAGDGIDITDNEISVDTTVIQPLLTAGTGIDITDNTISATGGGGSVTVVQTPGDSTTDVISQDASTKLIFPSYSSYPNVINIGYDISMATTYPHIAIGSKTEASNFGLAIGAGDGINVPSAKSKQPNGIALGSGAVVNSQEGIAIGYATVPANARGSIAIGDSAGGNINAPGMVDIGTSYAGNGYSNSNYRLLTGVYDGQNAHDAVTVEQVNGLIDAINTALSVNIPHIGAQNS